MVNIAVITGARPNYMKVSNILWLLRKVERFNIKHIHTNQHYDNILSEDIFKQLKLIPDIILNPDRTNSVSRLSSIIIELSKIFEELDIDTVIIPGDIDSSLAAAITALKCNIKIVHIESGLRSFDRSMPEEQNRIVIDEISNILFITELSGLKNLSPCSSQMLFFVGNTMIDSIVSNLYEIDNSEVLDRLNLISKNYILCTFHRPSNVDDPMKLEKLFRKLLDIKNKSTIVFPIHPRTETMLNKSSNLLEMSRLIRIIPAVNYFDFQKLLKNSSFVITDSGGIQEEAAYYSVQCFTYRLNTERPATILSGSNKLLLSENWQNFINIENDFDQGSNLSTIELWDGKSSDRIVELLKAVL